MKMIKIIFLFFIVCILTGCYNYKELNQIAIATAIGIDKSDAGYKMTFQIVNTQQVSSTSSNTTNPKFTIYTCEGKTEQEAIRNFVLLSPKKLYLYHLQIVVIGEELAKDGIESILDLIFRSAESRKQFYILIAKNATAEDTLKILTPMDSLNSSSIQNTLVHDNNYLGESELLTIEDLISDYLNDNIELSIPTISIQGDADEGEKTQNLEESEQDTQLVLSEMSIFKNDKLVGYTTKEESIALSFIKNQITNTIITYECDTDKYLVARIITSNTKISIKKNKLKVNINITGNGNISEIHCDLNIEKSSVIEEIEDKVNKEIEDEITNSIYNIIATYNSDIFGFLDLYYKNNYTYYKKIKDEWYSKNLKKLKVSVNSNIQILEKGNIIRVTSDER